MKAVGHHGSNNIVRRLKSFDDVTGIWFDYPGSGNLIEDCEVTDCQYFAYFSEVAALGPVLFRRCKALRCPRPIFIHDESRGVTKDVRYTDCIINVMPGKIAVMIRGATNLNELTFARNTYRVPANVTHPFVVFGVPKTWGEWRALGFDQNSTLTIV